MIALDGRFYRADVDGQIGEIEPEALTPFAVVVAFEPSLEAQFSEPLAKDALLAALEERIPAGSGACALRIDGDFERVHARSVPRQELPYRPLAEVIEDQHVFDLPAGPGTIVGFRFPDHGEGVEVAGFHLHFISGDRRRGGHVLDFTAADVTARLDPSSELHVELPPGVDLTEPHLEGEVAAAIHRVEAED